jgi:hypothetical protein
VLALLLETSLLALHLLLGTSFLTKPLALFAFVLLLLGHLVHVVGGQFQLQDSQRVIVGSDADVHRAAELLDRRRDLRQPVDGGVELVGLEPPDDVVGLGVVGAE